MKKIFTFIILFLIGITTIFADEESGAVHGKISGGKAVIYNMRNIYLELKDENENFINSAYIQPSRDFYFFNVKNGKYVLEVTEHGDTKRFYFEKTHSNIYIGEVSIEIGEKAIQKNLLMNLLFGITALVNFIIIFIIRKGNEFESKNKIINALNIYNLGYIVMFFGFILSFFEKDFSYLLIPIAYFIWDILMIMLLLFFMGYPLKVKSKIIKAVAWIIIFFKVIFAVFLLLDRYYSNIFLLFDIFKDSRVMAGSADIMYYMSAASDIVMAGFIALILLLNIKKKTGSVESMISRFFSKTLLFTIPILIAADIFIRVIWPGRFEGYSEIAHSIFNLVIMMMILLGVSGAKMLYGRKRNTAIFREVIKYYIFMLLLYGIIIFYESVTFALLMMAGVLLKALMDFIVSIFIKKYRVNYEKILSKLESIIEPDEFFRVLSLEVADIMECEKVEVIVRNIEVEEKFLKIESSENKVVFGEKLESLFKNYKTGVKIEKDEKLVALMLIGNKKSGKNIKIKDINFLLNFSEDISKLLANMSLKAAKRKIEVEEESECQKAEVTESMMYIQKIAEMISQTTGEEKTKKLTETILKEINKARGEMSDERD